MPVWLAHCEGDADSETLRGGVEVMLGVMVTLEVLVDELPTPRRATQSGGADTAGAPVSYWYVAACE